ncbi:Rrp15p domain-containing protein [Trichoderma sp. SZMC 28014]
MAGLPNKKRRHDNKSHRPTKKQRQAQAYNSDSDNEEEQEQQAFDAVNLLDSDDDVHNAPADDGADADENLSSSSDEEAPAVKKANARNTKSKEPKRKAAQPEEDNEEEEEEEEKSESENDDEDDDMEEFDMGETKTKSKRNDPTAFATSLSKILSTKLSTSKRSDPVLSRSVAAHEASKAAVDLALEAKARRKLKEQKRVALEKGRVKDILVATIDESGEPEMTTSDILAIEKGLRKTAQRGVIRMFNAVRAAQVQAADAEKTVRKEGVIGKNTREEKINEMSKKGFLDLIASGGGGLKKTPLEEA